MRSLTEEDSKRITSLRFLLIMFVVCIHNNLTAEDAVYYHLAFTEPAVITWCKMLVTSVLGGAAVPLFFLFAGYLQCCKQDAYPTLLKKRAKSLFVPYVIWTLLNVGLFFVGQSFPQLASFFQNQENIVRNWRGTDWLNLFWTHESASTNELQSPFVFQFWFVRDLLVLIILSPLLQWLAKKAPFIVLVGMTLGFVNGLPLGFGTALFFYMSGFFFAEYNLSFFKLADKITWISYGILLLFVLIVRLALHEKISLHGLGTIISCLFFL